LPSDVVYLSGRKGKTRRVRNDEAQTCEPGRKVEGGLLEVIHAISAIILWQQSEKMRVCGILLSSCLQTNLSVLVVDLVDEETASVLQKI
jgi:hypothetical protein